MIGAFHGVLDSVRSGGLPAGAIHRYNAQNVVLDGGGNIQQFTDLIGSNHLTQSNPMLRPLLVAAAQNGKPGARFTAERYLTGSAFGLSTAYTLLLVYSRTAGGRNAEYILGKTGGGVYAYVNSVSRSFGQTDGVSPIGATAASHSNAMSIHTHQPGALYRNTTLMPLAVSGSPNMSGLNALGSRTDASNVFFTGDLLDLVVYPTTLNTTLLAEAWAFLNTEYALY